MSRRVLITGAAGFLGSHLCDYYLKNGDVVVGIDNLSTGSMNNIEHLKDNKSFTFIEHDIVKALPEEVTKDRFDLILNMASPASPPHYQRLNVETLQVGSVGTFNILELAYKMNARLFHASTSEVYGDPEVHPQPESYKGSVNCYGPRSMYDEAKRYSEALIYSHHERNGTNTCIGRFFNTYGPRMDANDGRVVSNFIVQSLQEKPLTIYGNGHQTRSFCYVDDLVSAIVKLTESKIHDPMNLGNPDEFTIEQLADIVLKKTGSKSGITHLPMPGDDPLQRKPVIDFAKRELNWEPTIKLDQGLDSTIDYFRSVLSHTT